MPIFGLVPSVGKATLSSFELVGGLAGMIIFGPITGVTCKLEKESATCSYINLLASGYHAIQGLTHLAYSIGNIATLTILGTCLEGPNPMKEPDKNNLGLNIC